MQLLLDSHIFLWYAAPHPKLREETFALIEAADDVYVSAASIWELSIKVAQGKLPESRPLADLARACDFLLLPVMPEHAEAVLTLAYHHRDPFDHLLLAQAKVEGLTFVTHDRMLADYGVPILLV